MKATDTENNSLLLQHADKDTGSGGRAYNTGNIRPHSLHQEEVLGVFFLSSF
jgi:hypothetical protein